MSKYFAEAHSTLRTVRDMLRFAVSRFGEAGLAFGHGCDNAYDEAAYLILHALHLPLDQLDPFLDARLTDGELREILHLLQRRTEERIPSAYLTGEAWLAGARFYVDERVIVPRSHIADLLNGGLDAWIHDPGSVERVLDLCTGSGCLAILAAYVFPGARVDAADISASALEVAARNVADHRLTDRVSLRQSDLFEALDEERYDLIVSNPPYVREAAMQALPDEYRYEPALALAGGTDGMDLVRRIVSRSKRHLTRAGLLLVEVGDGRAAAEAAFPDLPFTWIDTNDESGQVFLLERGQLPD